MSCTFSLDLRERLSGETAGEPEKVSWVALVLRGVASEFWGN